MSAQLALRLEQPPATPALIVRAGNDRRNLRAVCDWTWDGNGWTSANGWTVRPHWIGGTYEPTRWGWAAFAPDDVPEWWAYDAVTAMVRAEGGS